MHLQVLLWICGPTLMGRILVKRAMFAYGRAAVGQSAFDLLSDNPLLLEQVSYGMDSQTAYWGVWRLLLVKSLALSRVRFDKLCVRKIGGPIQQYC